MLKSASLEKSVSVLRRRADFRDSISRMSSNLVKDNDDNYDDNDDDNQSDILNDDDDIDCLFTIIAMKIMIVTSPLTSL